MEIFIIVLLLAILIVLLVRRPGGAEQFALLMQQQLDALRTQVSNSLKDVTDQLSQTREKVSGELSQTREKVAKELSETREKVAEEVTSVQKTMTETKAAVERMVEIGKDISSLQGILRPPGPRGALGELMLEQLLRQILPDQKAYKMQYRFKTGDTVDAVIDLGMGKLKPLVPVDAKFPLESFERVLKAETGEERKKARRGFVSVVQKHINDIAQKYIRPDEGTFGFALMYIPGENVYYEAILKDEGEEQSIVAHAHSKKVIPCSPNSFYAYLQVIALGLKGLQIEKRAEEIIGHLGRLDGDLREFQDDFGVLGGHLRRAITKYDEADTQLAKFGMKLEALSAASAPELAPSVSPELPAPTAKSA